METHNKISHARQGNLYDSYFVTEYGRLEAMRATRFNNSFSIVLVDLGENTSPDSLGSETVGRLASAVLSSVRVCDVAGFAEDNQVVVILPETGYFGSLTAIRKLTRSIEAALAESGIAASLSQATFPKDGKGFGELLSTAVKRAGERRRSLWTKLGLSEMLFWEIIGKLTGESYGSFEASSFDAGAGFELSEFFIDQINELIIKEISRSPRKAGLAYFSAKKISPDLPVLKSLTGSGQISTKIYLAGEGEADVKVRNATPILLEDPRLREVCFTFYLSEDSCYALLAKENWGGTFSCFHSSDGALVEGLISKFQAEYSLQEQG